MLDLTKDFLQIIKQHDDWKHSVEVRENAKGEPSLTVKTRGDGDLQDVVDIALAKYKAGKEKLEEK